MTLESNQARGTGSLGGWVTDGSADGFLRWLELGS